MRPDLIVVGEVRGAEATLWNAGWELIRTRGDRWPLGAAWQCGPHQPEPTYVSVDLVGRPKRRVRR